MRNFAWGIKTGRNGMITLITFSLKSLWRISRNASVRFQHVLKSFQHTRVKPLHNNIFEISPD